MNYSPPVREISSGSPVLAVSRPIKRSVVMFCIFAKLTASLVMSSVIAAFSDPDPTTVIRDDPASAIVAT